MTTETEANAAATPTIDAVIEELTTLAATDITAPENARRAGDIMARTLLLDYVAYTAKIDAPSTYTLQTQACAFFGKNLNHKTWDTYVWGARIYAELHNCRQVTEHHTATADVFLRILKDVRTWKDNQIHYDFAKNFVFDSVRRVKAYNVVMEVIAQVFDTPELILARISARPLINDCIECNQIVGREIFDTLELWTTPPKAAATQVKAAMKRSHHAPILSLTNVAHTYIAQADYCNRPKRLKAKKDAEPFI